MAGTVASYFGVVGFSFLARDQISSHVLCCLSKQMLEKYLNENMLWSLP